MTQICETLKNGKYLTKKRITEVLFDEERNRRGFNDFRRMVRDFAAAKTKAERGEIALRIAAIGWGYNGKFSNKDVARTLLSRNGVEEAAKEALAQIDRCERDYKENARASKVIRRGLSQVIPRSWKTEVSFSAYKLDLRIYPDRKARYGGVLVEGAGNAYAFLTMLLVLRPILRSKGIKFNYDTLSTIGYVWSMGESKIAYGDYGKTGRQMLEDSRKSYTDYFANYALPEEVKETILDCLQQNVAGVQYCVWTDGEGGTYNSMTMKPVPENGVWTSVCRRKSA